MEANRTQPHMVVRVLDAALIFALERSNVCAVPLDGLPAHRAQPDDLRLFGHG